MASKRIPLIYPFGGLSENFAFDEQPPKTSREMRNVRGIDPKTGRLRGGSRAGLNRFMTDPLAAAPVKRIDQVVYDAPLQTYTDLGDALATVWSKANPSNRDSYALDIDSQSNLYVLDGAAGVVKYNSSGVKLFKIALPTDGKRDICKALRVDSVTGFIYVGVSDGNKSEKGKLFCYRQKDDNETDKVFEVEPGGWVQQLRIYQRQLYALLNFPDRNRAYIRVYGLINTTEPELEKQWEVPYPANDFDVSAKDGAVFVASDVNTQRGFDPRSPSTTQSSGDFTPYDLDNFKKRAWAWHDGTDRSTFALEPLNPDAGDDGAEVVAWRCKLKTGRDWYANRAISTMPVVPDGEAGAVYRQEGVNGMPCLSFTGARWTGRTDADPSGRSMVGLPASSTDRAYRKEQLSPVPTYKGAQFALFMVVKCGIDENIRALLSLPKGSGDDTDSRILTINRRPDDTFPGTNPMPGSVYLHEKNSEASDTGESTPDAGGASYGSANRIAPGPLSNTGLAVITWICDGGVHDVTGTASRSLLRINGHPIDRWQSAPFKTAEPVTLGIGNLRSGHYRFAGEVCEMFCLSDWTDQDGVRQRLVTAPTYPDSAWTANGDTEVERIEGYLAHKWGMAHELASGQADWLTITEPGPSAGDTVTIDEYVAGVLTPRVYTFRSSISAGGAANEVLIGSTYRETAGNLYQAINKIGEPGVDYDRRTTKHATVIALAAYQLSNTTAVVGIRSISPYSPVINVSESGANTAWLSATTAITIDGAGGPKGWYPHPFTLKKTTSSRGGPPGTGTAGANTQAQISASYLLQSPYTQLTKWSANAAKLEWVATSGYDVGATTSSGRYVTSATGLGGIGYGVRVNSEGEIYSTGPRQATVASPEAIVAHAVDIQKFGDTGTAFVTTDGGIGDPWYVALFSTSTSFESSLMRLDVDAFDNVYIPVYCTASGDDYEDISVVGYRQDSTGVALGVQFFKYSDTHEAYAVVCDPKKPRLPDGDVVQHGEFMYLATKVASADTTYLSAFKFKQLTTTNTSGSVRTTEAFAVCDGGLYSIALSGTPTLVTGATMDSASQFIDSAVLFGNLFLADGTGLYVYKTEDSSFAAYESTSPGQFLPRCKLLGSWRGRLVGARPADNGHNWFMTELGDPFNCDLAPFTITETQAILGSDSRAGLAPDIITGLIPVNDDLMLFLCDHSIHRMTGDPMEEGRFHPISQNTGGAFGRAWARDPEGVVYFFGSRGGVFRTNAQTVQEMTRNRIPRRLADVDLTTNRIEMAWSDSEDGLRVMVVPYGDGGTHVSSYFWERKSDAWIEDNYGHVGSTHVQPTCCYVIDGDDPDDRKLLFGNEDGRIRYHDSDALADDTEPIDSFALFGPFAPDNLGGTYRFSHFEIVTDSSQAPPNWRLYYSDSAQMTMEPKAHGRLTQGRSKILVPVRGAAVWLGLGLAELDGRWALESAACRVEPMGITRMLR